METPVSFQLSKSSSLVENQKNIYLEIDRGKTPMQVMEEENSLKCFFILPQARVGETLRGSIILSKDEGETGFSYDLKDGVLTVNYEKNPVVGYNYGKWLSKPYFYPVFSTNCVRVTEDGPGDHVHHRSLWVAHGDVNSHDFWTEFENSGKIEARDVKVNSCGKVFFELSSSNVWIAKSGSIELHEERNLRV